MSADSRVPFAVEPLSDDAAVDRRFAISLGELRSRTDRFFARILVVQWLATVALALVVTPRTWTGVTSNVNVHVWAAIVLGGLVSLFPAWMGFFRSGETATRHGIVAAQVLMSALLIHITGGRIETHFHVFGSLAIMALYRDWRVFITATIIVYVDHLTRGFYWAYSVYGVENAPVWRSLEHAAWVLFEVTFLTLIVRTSLREMRELVARQMGLELSNRTKDKEVRVRTQQLAETEEEFKTFFRDSPIGLYRAGADGEFQMANPAFLAILGLDSIDQLRRPAVSGLSRLFDAERAQFLVQAAASESILHRDAIWQKISGDQINVRESIRAIRDGKGIVQHIDGTVDDVTQHRQLEERYQQSQKVQAIGQLAGGVAHDFNNLLTIITGYSDVLMSAPGTAPELKRALSQINDAGNRAASLTRQLLAFSRKQRLQPRILQLNSVTAEMEQMLQRLVGETVSIRTINVAGLGAIRADPGQVQQVILNLVVNARDAMPNGGRITIETANSAINGSSAQGEVPPGNYVMLAVSDTGVGMTRDVQARLFEPFFTTKAPGKGTGLGLATCHGIVKQSGGFISVYSEPDHGTTFKVFLPVVAAPPETPAPVAVEPQVRASGERILLVEDDAAVREYGSDVLRRSGYNVITAGNGVEGIDQFLRNQPIDLVVTDVIMPVMGGKQLVEHVRKTAPLTKILLTSGYTFDALNGDESDSTPDYEFISKPYTPGDLTKKVRSCLVEGGGNETDAVTPAAKGTSY